LAPAAIDEKGLIAFMVPHGPPHALRCPRNAKNPRDATSRARLGLCKYI